MRTILRSDYFWQFVGGFVLGTIGVVSLHPGEVGRSIGLGTPAHAVSANVAN